MIHTRPNVVIDQPTPGVITHQSSLVLPLADEARAWCDNGVAGLDVDRPRPIEFAESKGLSSFDPLGELMRGVDAMTVFS